MVQSDGRIEGDQEDGSPGPVNAHVVSQIDQTNALLRAAMDELPQGIVLLDPDGRYVHWNKSYTDIYKRSADLIKVGASMSETLRIGIERGDYPEALGQEEQWHQQRMRRFASAVEPHEQRLSDGRWIMIEERRMPDGSTIGIRVDVTDIRAREASFRLLFENNPVPMFVYDKDTLKLLAANETARAQYGFSPEAVAAMSYADIAGSSARREAADTGDADRGSAEKHLKADGSMIDVATFSRAFTYEGRPAIITSAIDTTERNRSEARIAYLARHDAMTGLPNRTLFRERLEHMCAEAAEHGRGFDLLLIDLDGFKEINDMQGHATGDLLLQAVAARLEKLCPEGGIASRLGGDEFAILNPRGPGLVTSALLGHSIITDLCEPYTLDGQVLRTGASVGIARAPADGETPDVLMRRADLALYSSKSQGGGKLTFFVDELDAALKARRQLEADLRLALRDGDLKVHYQPIVDLQSGRAQAMEALLRWRHSTRGDVPPATFIPLAEELGLICEIGDFVMRQACKDATTWPDDLKVAVNLSPLQFRRSNVLGNVMSALATSGLKASRLEIEITEALLMDRSDQTLSTLHALRRLGVGISMDDFGTGYSSLSYLRNFPFTKIKIDRSFVQSISSNLESQAIVRAIVGLGQSLGMQVTAEGIETMDDLSYLRTVGCPQGQGYLFARPGPSESLHLRDSDVQDGDRTAA